MNSLFRAGLTVVAAVAVAGCGSAPRRTGSVSEDRDAAMIGAIKALEGTWVMNDESGAEITGTVYKTTAAGSAVHEVMFPGSEHEMVNLYHMDGSRLVVTHYCAAGNQPRMVASAPEVGPGGAQVYRFDFDSVTNLRPDHEHFMGGLVLTIDGDRLTQTWTSRDDRGNPAGTVEFQLTRK